MNEERNACLVQAKLAIDRLDYDEAQEHIVAALNLDSNYPPAYELLGEIFVEQDQHQNARIAFGKAIELDIDGADAKSGFEKYLWMGQLSEEGGTQAIDFYRKGVKRLINAIADTEEQHQPVMRARLASAYSAMAELYMTDLCMSEGAEQSCEKYVTNALLADDKSAEALQTLASMRLSQQRIDEAKTTLRNSISIWQDQTPGSVGFPTYVSRMSLVRLLLECEMTDDALHVLQQLEQEDDGTVELWYLYGWNYYLQGEVVPDADSEKRRELWEESRDCLHRCEKLYRTLDWQDLDLQEHASVLLGNIHGYGISIEVADDTTTGQEEPIMENEDEAEWESDAEQDEMEQ